MFALPYICNTGMAMLYNLVSSTGQGSDCSAHIAWYACRDMWHTEQAAQTKRKAE